MILILAGGWCADQVSENVTGICEGVRRTCLDSMKRTVLYGAPNLGRKSALRPRHICRTRVVLGSPGHGIKATACWFSGIMLTTGKHCSFVSE